MSFLSPWALFALAAAILPLWLHLRKGEGGRAIPFPPVRLLAGSLPAERRRAEWLRLLIRMAAIVAIALAAARPVSSSGPSVAPRSIALLVDDSRSTETVADGRRLFDLLRDQALKVIHSGSPDDRIWILPLVAENGIAPRSPQDADRALRALEPVDGRADLPGRLARATSLLASGSDHTPVIALLADGRRDLLRGVKKLKDSELHLFLPASLPPDRWIASLQPARQGDAFTMNVLIEPEEGGVVVEAARNGTVSRALTNSAGQATLSIPQGVDSTFKVSIPPDAFRADDSMVVASGGSGFALKVYGSDRRTSALVAALESRGLLRVDASAHRALVLDGSVPADATTLIVLIPLDAAGRSRLERTLAARGIMVRLGDSRPTRQAQFSDAALGAVAHAERVFAVDPGMRADTLLATIGGDAIVTRIHGSTTTALIIAIPPGDSSFLTPIAYPVIVGRALTEWTGAGLTVVGSLPSAEREARAPDREWANELGAQPVSDSLKWDPGTFGRAGSWTGLLLVAGLLLALVDMALSLFKKL